MVLRFARRSRQPRFVFPTIERADLMRVVRRMAIYVVPAIATLAFFTLIAWTIRRRLTLPDEITLESAVEPVEPAYDVSA